MATLRQLGEGFLPNKCSDSAVTWPHQTLANPLTLIVLRFVETDYGVSPTVVVVGPHATGDLGPVDAIQRFHQPEFAASTLRLIISNLAPVRSSFFTLVIVGLLAASTKAVIGPPITASTRAHNPTPITPAGAFANQFLNVFGELSPTEPQ